MDPVDPFNGPNIEWLIQNEVNDDIDEQILKILIKMESEQQIESSTRPKGTRRVIKRKREEGHARLFNDYFSNNPVYTEDQFRRRFKMRKHVFMRIVEALSDHDQYFKQRRDATGLLGLSPLQKCTSAIRMLAYGSSADSNDDYVRMAESTSMECLNNFLSGVIRVFGDTYLRRPNDDDVERLLKMRDARGFPGMLGSIDCMHWKWKNCPTAWKGMFCRGEHGAPTVMLEAVASHDLWIWHVFFGVAGSNNDINVLHQSNVFDDVLNGRTPKVHYIVNQTPYDLGYYLADGIYPEWAAFVKSIPMPQGDKRKLFAKKQESARKDIERAFGVLQARFAIIRNPARTWQYDQRYIT